MQIPDPTRIRRWIVETMTDPVEGPLKARLLAAQDEVIRARVLVLIGISLVVMPTTIWGYVAVVAPEVLGQAVLLVLGACAAVLVHGQLVRRGVFEGRGQLAMLLLVAGVFGPTGAIILELTSDGEVSFLFAFFLIYYAFMALFPASAVWVLATSILLILAHVSAAVLWSGSGLEPQLITHGIYLLQLTFIGLVLNRVVVNLFFAERRAALELEAANVELRELDRAKTSFFSNVSHELRTPLTLILTPLKQILEDEALPPVVASRVRGAVGNANRLLRMVNLLLDFARIEAGQGKVIAHRVSVDDLVQSVGELFDAAAAEREIDLVLDVSRTGVEAVQDLDKLEQILVNLIGNAVKFTHAGGRITVSCRQVGDRFTLAVADTGIGIPQEAHHKVFERFGQIDSGQTASVRGTGIGLSMVREFARLMGGDVSLESEVGRGSTFTVDLPLRAPGVSTPSPSVESTTAYQRSLAIADLDERRSPTDERAVEQAGAHRPRVLVVDDNPALVSLVRSILEDDYNLFLAYDGQEALDRIARDPVDLVISDVMMPGMTGLQLCQAIKGDPATRLLPVILLTAQGGQAHKVQGIEHGADDYIGKPFDPQELRARVAQLFEIRKITQDLERANVDLAAAYRQLKDEEVKLVSSEKLRTMGELAAGIFHELHNYINMIHNGAVPLKELVELAQQGEELETEEVIELADLILEASTHARGVTGELKGYAHQATEVERVLDLHDVVRSSLRMFGKLPQSLDLQVQLPADPLPVRGIRTRLVQVFTNLLKNAMEAMEHRGTLSVVSGVEGDRVYVAIRDQGPGVPEEDRERIFEPFQTTKQRGVGLGLGLSMSRKIVEELGGELDYDATWTEGGCFKVWLRSDVAEGAPRQDADTAAE